MAFLRKFAVLLLLGNAFGSAQASIAQEAPDAHGQIVETYSSWTVRCRSSDGVNPDQNCSMSHQVRLAESNNLVLSMSIRRNGDGGKWRAAFVTLFGITLSKGVELSVAGNQMLTADYVTCRQRGCLAGAPLNNAVVDALKAGIEAKAEMAVPGAEPIIVSIPLDGFSAAWNRLQSM